MIVKLRLSTTVLLLASLPRLIDAFYLPGVAPKDFKPNDRVELLVNALSSPETVLPYDQYYEQLHFCVPAQGPQAQSESLGSILFGDRLYDSSFQLLMKQEERCKKLCEVSVPVADAMFINGRIKEKYMFNW
jgi:transmembrane 9 superfamily protein 2/4